MPLKKSELVITAGSVEEAKRLFAAGADAVTIGHEKYGLRMPGSFDLPEIKETAEIARRSNKKVYVSIHALLHHQDLQGLDVYVKELQEIGVDAIMFGDPAVLMAVRQVAPKMKLHWNTETTSTNFRTVNYWGARGASRAILARELSLANVIEVKNNTKIEVQAQIHGLTCIFHSKRDLVSNYMKYQGKDLSRESRDQDRQMYLKETTRDEQRYSVFEDCHGTHIMSHEDICMLEHLGAFLQAGIDALKIEGILKTMEYNETVVSIYRQAIDRLAENPQGELDPGWMEEIRRIQPKHHSLGTGFYFKEQIY